MKQTNNAIKFLMAQYRAIFRNANLKMFLAAATAAAALSAGQAQAAKIEAWDGLTGTLEDRGGTADTQIQIVGTAQHDTTVADGFDLTLTAGGKTESFIKGTDGQQKFGPADDASPVPVTTITLNAKTGKADGTTLAIGGSAAADRAEVTITNLNVNAGTVSIDGAGGSPSGLYANNIQVGPSAASKATDPVAVISLNANSVVGNATTEKFDIFTGGQLLFSGENAQAESKNGINISGGSITVAKTATKSTIVGKLNVNSGNLDVAEAGVLNVGDKVTVSGGEVKVASSATATGGSLTFEKGLDMSSGTITVTKGDDDAKAAKLKIAGKTSVTGGSLNVGAAAVVTLEGDASFAKSTLKVENGGKLALGTLKGTESRQLTVYSSDIKGMLATAGAITGTGAAANQNTFVLKLSDTDVVDLSSAGSGLVQDATGEVSTGIKLTKASLKIAGDKAKFLKGSFSGATAYDFNTIEVGAAKTGTDKEFLLSGGAAVTVHNGISAADNANLKTLTVSGGTLSLAGKAGATGDVKAETIVLNDPADKATSKLVVDGGTWNVNALTLTKGTAELKNTKLNVAGKLAIADAEGIVTAKASEININGEKSDLSVKAENGIQLSNTSTLNAKASDFFKLDGEKVTIESTDFKKGGISGDATSVLNLTGFDKTLTDTQLKAVVGGIGFGGILSGLNVDTSTLPKDGADISEISSGSDAYKTVVVSVSAPVTGSYSVEGVKLKDPATELVIGNAGTAGSMTLNNPQSGKFVTDAKGEKVAGVKLDDAKSGLVLAGSGEIGAIDASADGNGSVTIGQLDKGGNVTVGQIGKSAAVGALTVNENVNVTANGNIKVNDFIFNGNKLSAIGHAITVGGADVSVGSGNVPRVVDIMGDVDAQSLTIDASQKKVSIAGGAHVTLESLNAGAATTTIYVGQDGKDGLEAVVDVGALVLGGATLAVDPEYGKPAALVFAKGFNDAGAKNDKDAGLLGGKFIIGQNSAVAVGFNSEAEARLVLNEYLVNKTGDGFANPKDHEAKAGLVANALVLNKRLSVGSTDGILVDSSVKDIEHSTSKASGNQIDIKGKSALVITDNVYNVGAGGKKEGSAITFTTASGKVNLDNTSSIILAGDFDAADKDIQIFAGQDASKNPTVTVNGTSQTVAVKSSNGLLSGTLGTNNKLIDWSFKDDGKTFRDASAPVTEIMLNKVQGKYKANAGKGFAGYEYLTALSNGTSAAGLDKLTHAATFAGAQQAAVASVTTMAEAVGGRVGALGVEAASIAATGSQANGGVWVTPMYKSVDADGFAAQGTTYGSDIDLAGVTFGADTVNGNMRFGAAFNIGSGKADGKGQGEGLKDDFDYYGFGIYSAMGFGNFALVGDASLNVISHDVEGYSGVEEFGTAKGKADTTAVTMGVTGQYTISSPMVDVTPHLGARFIRLDTDSYDVNTNKGVVASTDFDVQNVFSIPLGVSLSKAFEMGGWSLAPSADLTITFNTGDTDAKSNSYITGVENASFTTEVLDEVTYGVALGLGAQYGAFGTTIGINYTGSENTDSFGVNANARYMF